jgi:hypothetical protein
MTKHAGLSVIALLVLLGACDGDDGGGDDDTSATEQGTIADDAGGGGEPTLTTDPGTAYAEVDGERFEYRSSDSIAYSCEIDDQRITVNFQTPDGQDLLLQATSDGDTWRGQLTFASADDSSTRYSASIDGSSGLEVGEEALSYDGPVDRIEDADLAGADELDAEVAVNCASTGESSSGAGGDPVAEIGGETYTFELSGAQSVTCDVAPDDVEVRINRLALDDLQLEIDMTGGPGDWLGSVAAYTPDGTYRVTLSGEAEGFAVDGDTVTYDGPLEVDGVASEASVSVTCP